MAASLLRTFRNRGAIYKSKMIFVNQLRTKKAIRRYPGITYACKNLLSGNNGDMPKESHGDQTPDNLDAVALQFEECAKQIRGVAMAMRTAKIEQLRFTHFDSFDLGVTKVLAYTGAAHKRMFEYLKEGLTFGKKVKPKKSSPK